MLTKASSQRDTRCAPSWLSFSRSSLAARVAETLRSCTRMCSKGSYPFLGLAAALFAPAYTKKVEGLQVQHSMVVR